MKEPRHNPDRTNDRRRFLGRFFPPMPSQAAPKGRMAQKKGCMACGACVRGCENGALYFEDCEGTRIKWWDEQSCEKCGQCVARCPDSLLTFESNEEPRPGQPLKFELMRFQYRQCLGCQTTIRAQDGRLCIPCQRRGGIPGVSR